MVCFGRGLANSDQEQRVEAGSTYYYVSDALGSVVALAGASSNVATYSYDPYGKVTSSGTVSNPWRFAGGYFDSETKLTKFGTRYYDPAIGRWTQRDPEAGRISDPMTMNPYLYVGGNPVNLTDPSGRHHTTQIDCSKNPSPFCVEDYGDAVEVGISFAIGCQGLAELAVVVSAPLSPLGQGLATAGACLVGGVGGVYGVEGLTTGV